MVIYRCGDEAHRFESIDYDGRLLHIASVTKIVVNLAVARAVFTGVIPSIDGPACRWLTEWSESSKAAITVRHLMAHTSGVACDWAAVLAETPDDLVAYSLDSPLVSAPGAVVAYNNLGAMLLTEIVHRATGDPIEVYLQREVFAPLGIEQFAWNRDKAGHVFGMSALQLTADDLALIGQIWLQRGQWNGETVFADDWVDQCVAVQHPDAPRFGLLMMRHPPAEAIVHLELLPRHAAERLSALEGRKFPTTRSRSVTEFVRATYGPDAPELIDVLRSTPEAIVVEPADPLRAFGHDGSGGQHLWISPAQQLVGVRLRDMDDRGDEAIGFDDFPDLLTDLDDTVD